MFQSSPSTPHTHRFDIENIEAVDAVLRAGVRRTFNHWGADGWEWRDFEDVVGEAWVDFLQAKRDGRLQEVRESVAASGGDEDRIRKVHWVFVTRIAEYEGLNYLKGHWHLRTASWPAEWEEGEKIQVSPSTGRRLRREFAEALTEAFLDQRVKKGARGAAAASRDVSILDLSIQGYSDDGIAMELGCTPASAKSWRRDIKARLRRIADAGGLDTPDHPAPAPGHTCARCGAPAHSWHHIVPRRAGGEDGETTPLCLDCHSEAENWYMRQERPGLTAADWRTIFEEWLHY